ncbi:hypothetical protein GUITHDRAFT_137615 [Guillardia theta CCMP2712]|uniref:Uncharacterized protein n=1 Tax=Guillardia theta (strain CCMP2712) TaxID=905079 RepID=L1JG16_GUITC|nr:hypothetical protein GUITHDRAFT_137615 [Guillardia theta CCMP2712]EKX47458.1 hypothetical protein GUITHDRAFT_137615 [Guillardia theta CCMP2712]|eukprot:XP_005834438.1 hypothetical protein GUITHDRAFT_137615 [Guillardia theta CCMP2712]
MVGFRSKPSVVTWLLKYHPASQKSEQEADKKEAEKKEAEKKEAEKKEAEKKEAEKKEAEKKEAEKKEAEKKEAEKKEAEKKEAEKEAEKKEAEKKEAEKKEAEKKEAEKKEAEKKEAEKKEAEKKEAEKKEAEKKEAEKKEAEKKEAEKKEAEKKEAEKKEAEKKEAEKKEAEKKEAEKKEAEKKEAEKKEAEKKEAEKKEAEKKEAEKKEAEKKEAEKKEAEKKEVEGSKSSEKEATTKQKGKATPSKGGASKETEKADESKPGADAESSNAKLPGRNTRKSTGSEKGESTEKMDVEENGEPADKGGATEKSAKKRGRSSRGSLDGGEQAAATPNEEERKSKRERKQTQFYDVTADGSSPAKKPETPGKGGGSQGAKSTASQEEKSGWPAAWYKLLDKKFKSEDSDSNEADFLRVMRGISSRIYVGRPVQVKEEGGWSSGIVCAPPNSDGSVSVLLEKGGEITVESGDVDSKIRFQGEGANNVEVGRHVLVMFEGDIFYVGVVASVEKEKQVVKRFVVFFEDGDRAEVETSDESFELLPQEWSEHVQRKGKWGWWGYNKDRSQRAVEAEAGPDDEAKGGKAEGKKRKRQAEEETNVKKTPSKTSGKNTPSKTPSKGKKSAESENEEAIASYTEQMRGSNVPFYVGCPVECKGAEGEGWVKGRITSKDVDGVQRVCLAGSEGVEVQVSNKTEADEVRIDQESLGEFAVGRHVQVLFETLWFVGIVVEMEVDEGKKPSRIRVRFEDGEDIWVDLPDPSAILIATQWSEEVAKACTWGWWGFNADRMKQLQKFLKCVTEPVLLEEGDRGGRNQDKEKKAETKSTGGRTRKSDTGEAGKSIEEGAGEDKAPDTPRTSRSGRQVAQDYTKMASGQGGKEEEEEEPAEPARKTKERRKSGGGKSPAGSQKTKLNHIALALSLCDSLTQIAFVDNFNLKARNKWKGLITTQDCSLKEFGDHLKTFETNLASSAMNDTYTSQLIHDAQGVRSDLLKEIAASNTEEKARRSVQKLASFVRKVLFKSDQERQLCCGSFAS